MKATPSHNLHFSPHRALQILTKEAFTTPHGPQRWLYVNTRVLYNESASSMTQVAHGSFLCCVQTDEEVNTKFSFYTQRGKWIGTKGKLGTAAIPGATDMPSWSQNQWQRNADDSRKMAGQLLLCWRPVCIWHSVALNGRLEHQRDRLTGKYWMLAHVTNSNWSSHH